MMHKRYIQKISLSVFVALVLAVWFIPDLAAHHGWGWALDKEFEITGKISAVSLGNPHGELTLAVDSETWVVEVGQPWRNERAGLTEELLRVGRVITVHGHRSAREGERLVKAERLVIDGKDYNLYPDRKS